MLKLDDIGLVLENIRPIFFDFGLILRENVIMMAETVFHIQCAHTCARIYSHTSKRSDPSDPRDP
jgi:hypothetical protein